MKNGKKEEKSREGSYVHIYSCPHATAGPNYELRIVGEQASELCEFGGTTNYES